MLWLSSSNPSRTNNRVIKCGIKTGENGENGENEVKTMEMAVFGNFLIAKRGAKMTPIFHFHLDFLKKVKTTAEKVKTAAPETLIFGQAA